MFSLNDKRDSVQLIINRLTMIMMMIIIIKINYDYINVLSSADVWVSEWVSCLLWWVLVD